jgi:hypothetical protein
VSLSREPDTNLQQIHAALEVAVRCRRHPPRIATNPWSLTMMKRIPLATALLAGIGAGTAFASNKCRVPMSEWQPREGLQQKLEAEG